MRVTQSMLNTNMLRNLNNSMNGMNKYMDMLASGKRVNRPSDDPVAAVRTMYHKTSLNEIEQFQRNSIEAMNWLDMTDEALGSVVTVIHRVRELIVDGSVDTKGADSKAAIAQELQQLRDQIGNICNTSIGGRYIFSGTDTRTPPYDEAAGAFTNTNNAEIRLEMGQDIFLPVNIPGVDIFTDSTTGDGRQSIFKVIDAAITDLQNDESGSVITGHIASLEQNFDLFTATRSSLGARVNRIELVQARLDDSHFSSTKLLSDAQDADIPKVITELRNQSNVHQAALSAGMRIIQPTLLDFLR